MSFKEQAIAIVNQARTTVNSAFDSIVEQITALPDVSDDVVTLQQQVADLQSKLEAALAEVLAEEAKLTDELTKEAALQAKLDKIKAALEA